MIKTRDRQSVIFLLTMIFFLFVSHPLWAATFTVNSLMQAPDAAAGNGTCATAGGECSLQAAIDEAEALAGSDTIELASAATYSLAGSCTGTCAADNAMPNVTTTIIINGNGSTLDMAGGTTRFFEVTGNLTLNALNITDANSSYPGGAIFVDTGGTVTINNTAISNNTACTGASDYGGAINTLGTLTINSSSIANNICTSGAFGGAIYGSNTSSITISKSAIYGNMAIGGGADGGAVAAFGDLSISNSTISGNHASDQGGGVFFNGTSGSGEIIYSTIYDNEAPSGSGGGIYTTGTSSLDLISSIISTNTASMGGPDCYDDTAITSDGYNFISDSTNCTGIVGGDQVGGTAPYHDGIVAALGDIDTTYGRIYYVSDYTGTITEAGNPAYCSGTDMLGQTRGTPCDLGAVEQAWCGDGILQTAQNSSGDTEQCDDGDQTNGDGCSSTCQTEGGGGGGGGFIVTINTDVCETSHTSDSNLSLGELILLVNGTLSYGTLTAGEQALMTSTSGASTVKCSGSGCTPNIDCALPTISNSSATIFGDSSTPFTITSSGLGNEGRVFEIAGDSVTVQHMTFVGDNDSTAILATGNSVTVSDVTIAGYDTGLKLSTVTTATIGSSTYPNYFYGNGLGVLAQTSGSLTFSNNIFGMVDGLLVDENSYGMALIDVSNSTFTDNVIGSSSQTGLIVSGATNLTFSSNYFGTNINGSRPLGLNWQTDTGVLFEILTTSPDSDLIPLPATTSISGINMGDSDNSALNNLFCYNSENMIVSGADVDVSIGLNDFCSASGSSGYYTIREGANAGSLESTLSAPEITEIVAVNESGTNYTITVTGSGQAGSDVRIYKQEVSADGEAGATTFMCDISTDALGNFEDECESEMYATTQSVYFLAQACSQNCVVVSEFSTVSALSTITLVEEEEAGAGAGYQNAAAGGGCSLVKKSEGGHFLGIMFLMYGLLWISLKSKKHSLTQ